MEQPLVFDYEEFPNTNHIKQRQIYLGNFKVIDRKLPDFTYHALQVRLCSKCQGTMPLALTTT